MKIEELKDKEGVWIQVTKVFPLTFLEINDFGIAHKTKDQEELKIGEFYENLP
jgi:hypothetical protein